MKDKDFVQKMKNIPPEELAAHGLLDYAPDGNFICPFCGNGEGHDGTGVKMEYVNGAYILHCFRCHGTGLSSNGADIFHIVAKKFNLPDFKDQVAKLKEIFGDNFSTTTAPKNKRERPEPALVEKFIRHAFSDLSKFVTDSYRGLPFDVYKKFLCGFYDGTYTFGKGLWTDFVPRFIIPTSFNHYAARYVGEKGKVDKAKEKVHTCAQGGYKELFGVKVAIALSKEKNLPIFVVEGEFDAMSIDYCGFPAIAISGNRFSEEQIARGLSAFDKDQKFIVMLDNDQKNADNPNKIATILNKNGFKAVVRFLDCKEKDANDCLVASNTSDLTKLLSRIVADSADDFNNLDKFQPKNLSSYQVTPTKFNAAPLQKTATILDAPINLTVPLNYALDTSGIRAATSKGDKRISHTPILITKVFQTENNSGTKYELSVFDVFKNSWQKITLPKSDLVDNRKILKLADYGVSITAGNAKYISAYLDDLYFTADNRVIIPRVEIRRQPGWNADCTKFYYPNADDDHYVVEHNGFDYKNTFTTKGDKTAWLKMFKKTFAMDSAMRFVYGAALAGPCVRLVDFRNMQLNLNAISGNGKSARLKCALSIFGNPEEMIQSFNTTANAMDIDVAAFNDLPCSFNDFQSSRKNLREDMDRLVYTFEEGRTCNRLDKDSNKREVFKYKGVRLTAAEQAILSDNAGQGALSRVLDLNFSTRMDNDYAVELHGWLNKNHGHFGKAWTDYLTEHKTEIVELWQKLKMQYTTPELLPTHTEFAALIHVALIHFCKMLNLDRALDVEKLCRADFDSLTKILPHQEHAANSTRALTAIEDMLNIYRKNFDLQHRDYESVDRKLTFTGTSQGNQHWGYIFRDGRVAIFPSALKKYLVDEAKFPSAEPIIRDLAERGLLDFNSDTGVHKFQRCKRFTSDGSPQWVYFIKAEAFGSMDDESKIDNDDGGNNGKESVDAVSPGDADSRGDDSVDNAVAADYAGKGYSSVGGEGEIGNWNSAQENPVDNLEVEDIDFDLPF